MRRRVASLGGPGGTDMDKLRRAYRSCRAIPFRLAGLRARWHELTSVFRR
jgi:hypothetical protein